MSAPASPSHLSGTLRQMLAVLEEERQALAALDLDAIAGTTRVKQEACDAIEAANDDGPEGELDPECRGLLEAARHANETNRRIRNLLAANIAARLEAMSGRAATYCAPNVRPSAHIA